MLNITEKIFSTLKERFGLVEKTELDVARATATERLQALKDVSRESRGYEYKADLYDEILLKLEAVGIDPSDLSANAIRKAVYKETPTTTKLKKLEVDFEGEISVEAAQKALQEKLFIKAAYIARKLEERGNSRKDKLPKKGNSTKASTNTASANK